MTRERRTLLLAAVVLTASSCDSASNTNIGSRAAVSEPGNPAMSAPDEVAWQMFIKAVGPAGGTTAFETWASDADTFRPGATWPTGSETANGLDLRPAVLPSLSASTTAAHAGAAPPVSATPSRAEAIGTQAAAAPGASPPNDNDEPGSVATEEVRRNRAAFDYIVGNKFNARSGLVAAYGQTMSFPVDSIEVKTNWLPVGQIPTYYPNLSGPIEQNFYVTKDSAGQAHALIAMHVISKLVPNWTWATFEHQLNRGRCDFMGCHDAFGATVADVAPLDNQGQNQGSVYPACAKTPALQALLKAASVGAVFGNYCLKGSQTDFTDPTGLAVRLGNSVTEWSFAWTASCMTCHATAGWLPDGKSTPAGNAPIGPVPSAIFWSTSADPPYQGAPDLKRIATPADFVWSVPFCAYDDVTDPKKPAVTRCAKK